MNFNLKILVAIDDRRIKIITQNLMSITSVRLDFTSLNWFKTCLSLHIVQILWKLIKMFEIPIIRKPLENHIEFEWKFKFLMKLWKCVLAWWQFSPCGGCETNFDICIMLNLMSNSLSFGKLIKLYENLVEIRPIWWPPKGFCSPTYWVWCLVMTFFILQLKIL